MNPFLKFFIRFLLVIIIFLFYLKYRNNQCIKNQNCQPYFVSRILEFKRNLKIPHVVIYKIQDNLPNIDIFIEPSIANEGLIKNNYLKSSQIDFINQILTFYKTSYDDISIVNNNDIIIKKFSLKNTSNFPIKVSPKMTFGSSESKNGITIYNCFCDSKFIVEPRSFKDIYIYFKVKDNENYKKEQELQILLIDISI